MERTFRSLAEGKSKDLESRDRMMKVKKTYITAIIALLALVSCQKEESYTGPCDVRFRAYLQDEVTVSRAYTAMPTDYADFTAGLAAPLKAQRYDAIIATYSLHHLSDVQKTDFLHSLLPLLKEGGRILIGDVAFPTRAALEACRAAAGDDWDDEESYFFSYEPSAA